MWFNKHEMEIKLLSGWSRGSTNLQPEAGGVFQQLVSTMIIEIKQKCWWSHLHQSDAFSVTVHIVNSHIITAAAFALQSISKSPFLLEIKQKRRQCRFQYAYILTFYNKMCMFEAISFTSLFSCYRLFNCEVKFISVPIKAVRHRNWITNMHTAVHVGTILHCRFSSWCEGLIWTQQPSEDMSTDHNYLTL